MTGAGPIHSAAAAGYTKAADTYVRGRPDYPAIVDQWLVDDLGLGPGVAVLDLGAGTGKFTKKLVATGAAVTVVEPVIAMLDNLQATMPEVTAVHGQAEAIPLPDASQDVVICAQAFHWFANQDALDHIARVLKPGGKFGLIWNSRDQRTDWVAALTEIMNPYEAGVPRHDKGDWKNLFPAPGFTPLVSVEYSHGHTGLADHVIVDRIMSVSFIAALPVAEQAKVEQQIRQLIATTPSLADQQEVTFPYVTKIYMCERT